MLVGQGIAVGMATNVPPHNLGELVDGLVAIIDAEKSADRSVELRTDRTKHRLSDEELLKIIPAPDFPTGGIIMGVEGSRSLYTTGKGSVVVRARTVMEGLNGSAGKQRTAIVVTEVPYLCNKAALLEKIAR